MGKEDEYKKPPVPTFELEKLKTFDCALESVLQQIDPFNAKTPMVSSGKQWTKWLLSLSGGNKNLFQEYLIDPQKHRKSKNYSGFFECKQKFDIILSKEDPEQLTFLGDRLSLYSEKLPVSDSIHKMITFLKDLPPAHLISERKQIFSCSQKLVKAEQRPVVFTSTIKKVISEVLSTDSPPSELLHTDEKLKLLKIMAKYPGDWEKVSKKFHNRPIDPINLQKTWRCFKYCMNKESAEIQKKMPGFCCKDWLRVARKKLEIVTLKKKPKAANLKPKEERFDILSVMAEVENTNRTGIESATFLNFTAKSAFKEFQGMEKLQECCLNRINVFEC